MTTTSTLLPARIGDDRYRSTTPPAGSPLAADDTRLGRRVLVQYGVRTLPSRPLASRLVTVRHPAVVALLDAGDEVDAAGVRHAYTVFPVDHGIRFDDVDPDRWRALDLPTVAAVAAWLVAAALAVRTTCGQTVALRSSDVVVDRRAFDGDLADDRCPVRWLPSLADRDDDLAGVVATLVATRSGREQRRLAPAVTALTSPTGQPRAVRALAAIAGLDPLELGLAPHVPQHAGSERRSFGRRLFVGDLLPTTTRSDTSCASVEACS